MLRTIAITCLLASIIACSCGSGPSASGTGTGLSTSGSGTSEFVYVSNSGSNTVSGFTVKPGDPAFTVGAAVLSPVPGSPFLISVSPAGLAVASSNNFLIVADANSEVSVFRIDKNTGKLTPAPGSPYSAAGQPYSVVTHNNFAYVASRGSNAIAAFQVAASTGTLTPVAGSPFSSGSVGIESMAIDQAPHDTLLVVGGTGLANLRIEADGALTLLNAVCCSALTSAIAVRSGLLFVLSPSAMGVFKRVSGVAPDCDPLTAFLQCQAQVIQFAAGTVASSIGIDPKGKYVYVSDSASSNVNILTLSDNGAFAVSLSPYGSFQAGTAPSSIAVLPNGFVYVANQLSNDVSEFSIGPCIIGPVTPDECGPGMTEFNVALGSPFQVGKDPSFIIATQ